MQREFSGRRWWPKLTEAQVHPAVEQAVRQAYNAIYDLQDGFTALASQAVLHATVAGGVVTSVDVVKPGKFNLIPTISAVGGGGSGARFTAVLDNNGGIKSVVVVSGGSSYTSVPYITVTGQ